MLIYFQTQTRVKPYSSILYEEQTAKTKTPGLWRLSKNCPLCLNTSQKSTRQQINQVLLFRFSVLLATVWPVYCKKLHWTHRSCPEDNYRSISSSAHTHIAHSVLNICLSPCFNPSWRISSIWNPFHCYSCQKVLVEDIIGCWRSECMLLSHGRWHYLTIAETYITVGWVPLRSHTVKPWWLVVLKQRGTMHVPQMQPETQCFGQDTNQEAEMFHMNNVHNKMTMLLLLWLNSFYPWNTWLWMESQGLLRCLLLYWYGTN